MQFCNCLNALETIEIYSLALETLIALIGVALALYVFIYQKKQDKKDRTSSDLLNSSTVRLSWFKELIVLPNIDLLNSGFENILESLEKASNSESNRSEILIELKESCYKIRIDFIDLLNITDKQIGRQTQNEMDTMLDDISTVLSDQGINLDHPPTFKKRIVDRVKYCRNNILKTIFSFKG